MSTLDELKKQRSALDRKITTEMQFKDCDRVNVAFYSSGGCLKVSNLEGRNCLEKLREIIDRALARGGTIESTQFSDEFCQELEKLRKQRDALDREIADRARFSTCGSVNVVLYAPSGSHSRTYSFTGRHNMEKLGETVSEILKKERDE